MRLGTSGTLLVLTRSYSELNSVPKASHSKEPVIVLSRKSAVVEEMSERIDISLVKPLEV